MALDGRWGFPNTHQCMNPGLITTKAPRRIASAPRPMDTMELRSDLPQEDEFALLGLGLPSFYRVMMEPQRWQELASELVMKDITSGECRRWRDGFRQFLALMALTDSRPMLLKSPTHSFRIQALLSEFPESKIIVLLRDPTAVIASNVRLWGAMFGCYALEAWDSIDLLEMSLTLYEIFARQLACIREATGTLANIVFLRYEQLVADPGAALERIYARFGWTWDRHFEQKLAQEWLRRSNTPPKRHEVPLDIKERIQARIPSAHEDILRLSEDPAFA